MEKVKSENTPKKRESELGLRILAIIIAVIIWFILSITQYPTINKTITGIPVDFTMEGTAASERGLSPLNYSDITVDVEISGMNYEIGSYGANDITATVDLSEVTREGTYHLEIEVKSNHPSDDVTVISVNPEWVEVTFDRISTSTFSVGSESPLVSAEEGLMLREVTVSPSEIVVEGPENELGKIDRISAKVSNAMKIEQDTTVPADDVIFYDSDGNTLDSSVYTIKDVKAFSLNFVIYKKRTARFSVQFSDYPPGFDVDSLPYTLSDDSIQVISPRLDDSDIENVTLGTIPLSNVDLESSFSFEVDNAISSGEINQTGINTVTVTFDPEGYTSRTFTLPGSQVTVKNPPVGKDVNIETIQLADVKIFGPAEAVNDLDVNDLTVELDLSDVLNAGSVMHTVTVYAPEYNTVWCCGVNEVQVEITDKPRSTTTTTTAAPASSPSN